MCVFQYECIVEVPTSVCLYPGVAVFTGSLQGFMVEIYLVGRITWAASSEFYS